MSGSTQPASGAVLPARPTPPHTEAQYTDAEVCMVCSPHNLSSPALTCRARTCNLPGHCLDWCRPGGASLRYCLRLSHGWRHGNDGASFVGQLPRMPCMLAATIGGAARPKHSAVNSEQHHQPWECNQGDTDQSFPAQCPLPPYAKPPR